MSPHAASFESRVAVLGPLAYRVAFRILGDRPEAQDLTQEALARAYSRWGRVADYDEAWITRVVTNLALGEVRRRDRADRRVHASTSELALDAVVVQRAELVTVLLGSAAANARSWPCAIWPTFPRRRSPPPSDPRPTRVPRRPDAV